MILPTVKTAVRQGSGTSARRHYRKGVVSYGFSDSLQRFNISVMAQFFMLLPCGARFAHIGCQKFFLGVDTGGVAIAETRRGIP